MSHRPRILLAAVLALASSAVVASLPAVGTGATSGTVVGATVPSAITLQDGCLSAAARSLGPVVSGSTALTATGPGVCRYTFSSSNSSSMLRMYQSDRSDQAMVGIANAWSQVSMGGADFDLANAGPTLMLAQDSWASDGTYMRSTDGGANWATFSPGGGQTRWVAAPSATVAWRFDVGNVKRSTDMQNATPTWTDINANYSAGNPIEVDDGDAIDASVAWTVSQHVYRTADAGATFWSRTNTPCTNADEIDATSASTAFVVGWGNICRTINSNTSWTSLAAALPAGFSAVDVMGSPQTITTIWAAGNDGRVLRSTNNGTAWPEVTPTPIPVNLTTIYAVSDTEAYVSGQYGLTFRTTDSGTSWTRVRVPVTGDTNDMSVASPTSLLMASPASWPIATADGGTSWGGLPPSGDAAHDIDANDSGVLVKAQSRSRVYVSPDGGVTETSRNVGFGNDNVRGVAVIDDNRFIAVGELGKIAVSEDGGVTWTQRPSGTSEDLWDVDVSTEGVAIAVGASGTILRSTDWGWNWTVRASTGNDLRRVDLRSGAPVLAVGMGGTIRRSTDAGVTWTSPVSGSTWEIDSVSIASDTVAYAAHYGTLFKSIDGGATWTTSAIGEMARVEAVTPTQVWLTTSWIGGWREWANVSTDGGATWSAPWANQNPDVTTIHAVDNGTVYFAGHGSGMRVTDPPTTVANYTAGAWSGGVAAFGACLQDIGGAATVAAWTEDATGTCVANDATDAWYGVPTAPVKVAQMAAAGTGTVDIVWGFKPNGVTAPGTYSAGVVVEALAPNF